MQGTKRQRENNLSEKEQDGWWSRNVIAMIITVPVVLATVFIAVYIMLKPAPDGKVDMTFIGQTLLPLWGTWLGTVMAFYFGKSNFDAATKSYDKVIENILSSEEKLAKAVVKDVMIPLKEIVYFSYEEATDGKTTIKDILGRKEFFPYSRYAFIDEKSVLRHIIHRRNFTQFISDKVIETPGSNPADTNFNEYIKEAEDPQNRDKQWLGVEVYISVSDNLLKARDMITSIPRNKDVFVTMNGKKGEPLIGLITDEDILKVMNG